MLEMLVVLAILAVVSAASIQAFRPPSPKMQLNAAFTQLSGQIVHTRSVAITTGQPILISFDLSGVTFTNCNNRGPDLVTIFADGTASDVRICMELEGEQLMFRIDSLLGRAVRI